MVAVRFSTIGWMSWRNLIARKHGTSLSFMTIISIAGVAIGVAALIIVLSVMGGFEQDLRSKMLKGQPHLEIVSENAAAGFSLKKFDLKKFAETFPEASEIEAYVQADVVLKQGKHIAGVNLFGVDPARNGHLWSFGASMIEGELPAIGKLNEPLIIKEQTQLPGIVIGEELQSTLAATLGDVITVLSPQGASSGSALAGSATIARQYVLVGVFRTGLFNYDAKWAVVSLSEGRKFMNDYEPSLDSDEYVSGVALNLQDPYSVSAIESRVKEFSGLQPLSWLKANNRCSLR